MATLTPKIPIDKSNWKLCKKLKWQGWVLTRKFYIRKNNNKVDSIETGLIVIAHLLPWRVSGQLTPRKIAPWSGLGFGLGLALELRLGAIFLGGNCPIISLKWFGKVHVRHVFLINDGKILSSLFNL